MFQIQDKFQVINRNTQGTFFQANSRKDGKQVAIKKICFANMSEKDKKSITQEVNLLRTVKSNNIVKYYEYIIDKAQAQLYVIMQYCSGGSLEDYLQLTRQQSTFIEQKTIWKIFSQVVSAVYQIHNDAQGIILHRDIKPKNILLDKDNNIKLGNFSLLRRLNPEEQFALTYIPGTYYRSPQQIIAGIYSPHSDIWALGCLLYQMCTLKSPFKKNSEFLTAQSIKQDKIDNIPSIYSDQIRRVINWCLEKQRQNRPSAAMLKGIPQINFRLRRSKLLEYKKLIEQKEQKLKNKQRLINSMEERLRQLKQAEGNQCLRQSYQFNLSKKQNSSYLSNYQ